MFDLVRKVPEQTSPKIFGQYVISMTHEASHVLEVLFLGGLVGLAGGPRTASLLPAAGLPAVRDDRGSAQGAQHPEPAVPGSRLPPRCSMPQAACRTSCWGYSDSCQGRRHPGLGMEHLYQAQKQIHEISKRREVQFRLVPWPRRDRRTGRRTGLRSHHGATARHGARHHQTDPSRARCCRTSTPTWRRPCTN